MNFVLLVGLSGRWGHCWWFYVRQTWPKKPKTKQKQQQNNNEKNTKNKQTKIKEINKNSTTTKSNLDSEKGPNRIFGSSLSDKESMSCMQAGSEKSKFVSSNWPRCLVISSSDEGALNRLLPFAIKKRLVDRPESQNMLQNWKRVIIDRVFHREAFQMFCQSTWLASVSVSVVAGLLWHIRGSYQMWTLGRHQCWRSTWKPFITRCYRRQENKGPS